MKLIPLLHPFLLILSEGTTDNKTRIFDAYIGRHIKIIVERHRIAQMVKLLPSVQVTITGLWDQILDPATSWSLLFPLPTVAPACAFPDK